MPKTGSILSVLGLDVSLPAEYIGSQSSPNCQNMEVDRAILQKRTGTETFGTSLGEQVMAGRQFSSQDVNFVVKVGVTEIMEWDDGNGWWTSITGTALTGTTADTIDLSTPMLSGVRVLIITNGIDNPRKYTGTGNTADLGGSPPKAKYCLEYKDYLVLANIDDGSPRRQRVAWSDTGDIENWTTGNSGTQDLTEDGENITGLGGFGDYITIHKASSIYIGYLVTTSNVFKFDRKTTGRGAVANASIQTLPNGEQAFLATDGIRLFNGTSAPLIDSKINDEIRDGLNYSKLTNVWSIVVPEKKEYWVGVPLTGDDYGNSIYKYNYETGVCYKDVRSNITCAFKFSLVSQPTWDQEVGTWDAWSGRWDDGLDSISAPVILLNDASGQTYQRSTSVYNDGSDVIDALWESKDFQNEEIGRLNRWMEMEVWAKGDNVTVDYSTDRGVTWMNATTLSLNATFPDDDAPLRVYFDFISTKARFRFRNNTSGESFALKQFVVMYMPREMRN